MTAKMQPKPQDEVEEYFPDVPDQWAAEDVEGQLAVDVFQTPTTIVIKAAIAGVESKDVSVAVNRDVVTIRGKRTKQEQVAANDYLFQECYWGGFSRSIILPIEVEASRVKAELKRGILTITLPKAKNAASRVVPVVSDDE